MTKKIFNQVQDFLTVVDPDHTYQIVNVGLLLWQHSPKEVVALLNQIRREYKKELNQLLKENKAHPKVNFLVVQIFRLRMAMKTIQKSEKEEVKRDEHAIEQRTAAGGGLS
jgi:hypothetical protein